MQKQINLNVYKKHNIIFKNESQRLTKPFKLVVLYFFYFCYGTKWANKKIYSKLKK